MSESPFAYPVGPAGGHLVGTFPKPTLLPGAATISVSTPTAVSSLAPSVAYPAGTLAFSQSTGQTFQLVTSGPNASLTVDGFTVLSVNPAAGTGRWVDHARLSGGPVPVTHFGADATGVADSSTAFASAVSSLAPAGIAAIIAAGTYSLATAPVPATTSGCLARAPGAAFTGAAASQWEDACVPQTTGASFGDRQWATQPDRNSLITGDLGAPEWQVADPTWAPLVRRLGATGLDGYFDLVWVNSDHLSLTGAFLNRPFTIPKGSGITSLTLSVPCAVPSGGAAGTFYLQLLDATKTVVLSTTTFTPTATVAGYTTANITGLLPGTEYWARIVTNTGAQADFAFGRLAVTPTSATNAFWLSGFQRVPWNGQTILDNNEVGPGTNPRYWPQGEFAHNDAVTDAPQFAIETLNDIGYYVGQPFDAIAIFVGPAETGGWRPWATVDPLINSVDVNFVTLPPGTKRVMTCNGSQAAAQFTTQGQPRGTRVSAIYVSSSNVFLPTAPQQTRDTDILYGDSKLAGYYSPVPARDSQTQMMRQLGRRVINETYGGRALSFDVGPGSVVQIAGSVAVTNGSTTITFGVAQTIAAGVPFVLISQPGAVYTLGVALFAATGGTLSTPYTGSTAASTTAYYWGPFLALAQKLCRNNPTRVLWGMGRNDYGPGGTATFTLVQWQAVVGIAADAIHAVSPAAVVAFVTWTSETSEPNNSNGDTWIQWTAAMRSAAASRRGWCTVLEGAALWSLANAASYTRDGVHPNAQGQELIVQMFLQAYRQWTPRALGAKLVAWCRGAANMTPATMSAVTSTSAVTLTLAGTPTFSGQLLVCCVSGGILGNAQVCYSINGGDSWLPVGANGIANVATSASFVIPNTGLTATFSAGTAALNDVWTANTKTSAATDLSGSGNPFVQATDAKRPLAGIGLFPIGLAPLSAQPATSQYSPGNPKGADGFAPNAAVTSWLSAAIAGLAAPYTIYLVGKLTNSAGGVKAFLAGNASNFYLYVTTSGTVVSLNAGSQINSATVTSAFCNAPHVYGCFVATAAGGQLRIDGTQFASGTTGTNAPTTIYVGGDGANSQWYVDGAIPEFLVINGTLSADEILELETYLRIEYGTW